MFLASVENSFVALVAASESVRLCGYKPDNTHFDGFCGDDFGQTSFRPKSFYGARTVGVCDNKLRGRFFESVAFVSSSRKDNDSFLYI